MYEKEEYSGGECVDRFDVSCDFLTYIYGSVRAI